MDLSDVVTRILPPNTVWLVIANLDHHVAGVFSSEKKADKFIERWWGDRPKPTLMPYIVDYRTKDKPVKYKDKSDGSI